MNEQQLQDLIRTASLHFAHQQQPKQDEPIQMFLEIGLITAVLNANIQYVDDYVMELRDLKLTLHNWREL
jgi:hypothetical protein